MSDFLSGLSVLQQIILGLVAWLGLALVVAIGVGRFMFACDEDGRKEMKK